MDVFQHILLYSGAEKGAGQTFAKILELANAHKAKLTIVDVLEQTPFLPQRIFSPAVYTEVRRIAESRARKRLERLTARARDLGVEATSEVLFGRPFVELIRSVVRRKCDLVVKTARGGGGFRERLMGSTALHLIRKCPVPVLVVQPKRRVRFTRILVPLDFRVEESSEESVNATIMAKALSLAELDNSQLHFFHAWQPYGVSLLSSGRFRMPPDRVREYVKSQEINHKEMFEEFLNRYSLSHLKHQVHFHRGDPAWLIPELAARHRINLVVMGSTYSLGLAGIFLGSVAEQVIGQLECSILTAKPKGFVTPVKVV
jgi:nucleotide-binding universal stress UspA family protein